MEETLIEHAFNIKPTTVYGVLVAVLLMAIMALWYRNSVLQKKLFRLLGDTVGSLADINTALANVKEQLGNYNQQISKSIDDARHIITEKIKEMANKRT